MPKCGAYLSLNRRGVSRTSRTAARAGTARTAAIAAPRPIECTNARRSIGISHLVPSAIQLRGARHRDRRNLDRPEGDCRRREVLFGVQELVPRDLLAGVGGLAAHDRRERALGDLLHSLSGLPARMLAMRSMCSCTYGLPASRAARTSTRFARDGRPTRSELPLACR